MKRLAVLVVGVALVVVPGQALAALSLSGPADSTTLHADQTLTVSWTADGDAAANNLHPSYLLFTGASWTTRINLNAAGIAAHTISFTPDTTTTAFLAAHANVLSATTSPSGATSLLPADTYAIDLYIQNSSDTNVARASRVALMVQGQCAPGSFSSDGWPTCTLALPGSYAPGLGSTNQLLCPRGTFSPVSGATMCYQAPLGAYVPENGASAPTDCSAGSYQDELGKTSCKEAPAGTFVAVDGATAATPCPDGTTSPVGSRSAAACVASAQGAQESVGAQAAPVSTAAARTPCTVLRGHRVTATCVATATGTDTSKAKSVRVQLGAAKQRACRVRDARVLGAAVGTCRVVLVVTSAKGQVTRTPASVTVTAR